MVLPQPFRAIAWILTIIGIIALLFGIAENSIFFILVGGAFAFVFGTVVFFWGFPDEE